MFVAVQLSDDVIGHIGTKYIQVPDEILGETNRDGHRKARQIAFRLIYKRREEDLNELMAFTRIIQFQECSQEVAEVLLGLQ